MKQYVMSPYLCSQTRAGASPILNDNFHPKPSRKSFKAEKSKSERVFSGLKFL